jgi:hypothetical protein
MSDQPERTSTVRVTSKEELVEWWDEVQCDDDLAPGQRYLMLQLSSPCMFDRETWVMTWSLPQMVEATGRTKNTILRHKDDLLESDYVLEAGTRIVETGRGKEERDTYALVLPPTV